jgi:dTDP-4-dehydrorhamnose reductase
MKILIFGGSGQVGSELTKLAGKAGHTVKSVGHGEIDITDGNAVKRCIREVAPQVVINSAAYHLPAACEANPHLAFGINAVAVGTLSRICAEENARLVSYSSDYVFDGTKGAPYEESDMPNPLQVYGLSKYCGESLALHYGAQSLIIRTCGVYGGASGSREKNGNFVLSILRDTKGKETLAVSSEQRVSPTSAHDLATATLSLLEKNPPGGIYHLVNEGNCSWAEMAEAIVAAKKIPCRIIPVDRNGDSGGIRRPLFSALVNTKAKAMGVTLPSWQKGLITYLTAERFGIPASAPIPKR